MSHAARILKGKRMQWGMLGRVQGHTKSRKHGRLDIEFDSGCATPGTCSSPGRHRNGRPETRSISCNMALRCVLTIHYAVHIFILRAGCDLCAAMMIHGAPGSTLPLFPYGGSARGRHVRFVMACEYDRFAGAGPPRMLTCGHVGIPGGVVNTEQPPSVACRTPRAVYVRLSRRCIPRQHNNCIWEAGKLWKMVPAEAETQPRWMSA